MYVLEYSDRTPKRRKRLVEIYVCVGVFRGVGVFRVEAVILVSYMFYLV